MRAWELLRENRRTRLMEGGNAFDDVGTIHISEIDPTLQWLEKKLGLKNLKDGAVGSVGKVQYSGDMDIAIDPDETDIETLFGIATKALGADSVQKHAGNIITRVPIANYDEAKDGRQPRTGFVQVDFFPGKPEWMKTYYHSPGDTSKYRGEHRNIAVAVLASLADTERSDEEDDLGRPIDAKRWQWGGKNGLVRVHRTSRKNAKTGGWIKKQDTEVIGEPITNADEIAKVIFRGKAGKEALNSVETVIDAAKKGYSEDELQQLYKKTAEGIMRHNDQWTNFDWPEELAQYMT